MWIVIVFSSKDGFLRVQFLFFFFFLRSGLIFFKLSLTKLVKAFGCQLPEMGGGGVGVGQNLINIRVFNLIKL